MNPDLLRVRELQQVDLHIRELQEEIGRLPKHIAEIERQLEAHRQQLEADQSSLAENKKSHRLLESQIASSEQKASRLREQMNEAKTNDQFRAFQHEIQFVEDEIRKTEDRILDKMVEAETLGQNVQKAEEALAGEKKRVDEEVTSTRARVAKDEVELQQVRARRKQLAEAISPDVLRTYERVRKMRGGIAVAEARADRCLACNVVFRPQFSQELRRRDRVMTCESCGRILIHLPPESHDVGGSSDVASAASG